MRKTAGAQDLGQLSRNPYAPNSTANPYSAAGSPYSSQSVNSPYGPHGSPHSNQSATNPYATDAPKLYDSQGRYRGKLSSNPYDPESISNPYGRYGSEHSADSINNRHGAGNPYDASSPTNPYGKGWTTQADDDSSVRAPSEMPSAPRLGKARSAQPPTSTYRAAPIALPALGAPATKSDPWRALGDVGRETADDASDE